MWRSTTVPSSFWISRSPLTLICPLSKAPRQSLSLPFSANSLNCERGIAISSRASPGSPFVTSGAGIRIRNTWTSPRPRSSSRTTIFSRARAGTSRSRFRTAIAISSAGRAKGSDLVALQELLADHHLLDLGSPLANQEQRRVAVDPLDLVLLGIAVPAVDPQALLRVRPGGLGRKELGHPGLQVRALAGVLEPRRLQRHQPSGLHPGAHLGELEGDRLVLGDGLAERLSLLAVAERQLQRALRDAHATGCDVD